jgi:TolA-binding protein
MKRDVESEERYLILKQQVREQEAQIDRLNAAIEALKARPKETRHTAAEEKERRLPVKKLSPAKTLDDEDAAEEAEAAAETGEETLDAIPESEWRDSSAKTPSAASGTLVADSTHEVMHLYYRALDRIKARDYDGALGDLREFLAAEPDHVYADRAQFQIADVHFRNKEYGLAVVATNLLEARYPHSFMLPQALYERGVSYEEMGNGAQASTVLRELVKRFPADPAADQASKKLAALAGQKTAPAPPLL